MAKKKEIEETKSTYIPKKTNRGLVALLIVISSLMVIGTLVLPFILIFLSVFLFNSTMEFDTVNESVINVPKVGISVSVEDNYYDKKDECFVLSTKIEKIEKQGKTFLIDYDNLDITYTFKNSEGFVVGSESLYLEKISKYDKWKQNIYFCGTNADDITDYEVESVEAY